MKQNHYFALPVSLLIALLSLAILTAASSASAAEPPSVDAIQAINCKWKKAVLASTGDAYFQAATTESQKSLGAFES